MTSWRDMTYSANEKERFRKGRCLTQYIITGSRTNVPLFHILPDPPSSPFCLGILHWHWLRGDRKEPESLSPPFSNADHHPSPATVTRLPEEITMSLTHPMLATIPLAWCVLVGGGLWFSSHPFVWMWLTVGSSSHQEPKKVCCWEPALPLPVYWHLNTTPQSPFWPPASHSFQSSGHKTKPRCSSVQRCPWVKIQNTNLPRYTRAIKLFKPALC